MKNAIKKAMRKLGIDVIKFTPEQSEIAQIQYLLAYHKINLILDVGANIGQYAKSVRNIGYSGEIVSFEPLSTAYSKLETRSRKDPLWKVAPRTAIGNVDGEIEINISGNSQSSSLLKMLDLHLNAAPQSVYVGSEVVRISKLDTIAQTYVENHIDSVFLKIDVQGFEMQVIEGAFQILPKVEGIQMELSLAPLYEGQLLLDEMLKRVDQLGYELHAILPGFTDKRTGRLLQVDGVFFRK